MIKTAMRKLARDESGATAIEYGLIVALIALAMVTAFDKLGNSTNGSIAGVTAKISEYLPATP